MLIHKGLDVFFCDGLCEIRLVGDNYFDGLFSVRVNTGNPTTETLEGLDVGQVEY